MIKGSMVLVLPCCDAFRLNINRSFVDARLHSRPEQMRIAVLDGENYAFESLDSGRRTGRTRIVIHLLTLPLPPNPPPYIPTHVDIRKLD